MISTPISVQKQINSIVHQFIWHGPDKIKIRVLSVNYENRGFKMVDIVTKIKTQQKMWLKRFIDGNEMVWKLILVRYLNRIGGLAFLLKCNFDIKKLKGHIPSFYENILNAWVNINASIIPNGSNEVCKEVIWNNKYILVDNEMVFNKTLFQLELFTLMIYLLRKESSVWKAHWVTVLLIRTLSSYLVSFMLSLVLGRIRSLLPKQLLKTEGEELVAL